MKMKVRPDKRNQAKHKMARRDDLGWSTISFSAAQELNAERKYDEAEGQHSNAAEPPPDV
jgi:hypothetical protein